MVSSARAHLDYDVIVSALVSQMLMIALTTQEKNSK